MTEYRRVEIVITDEDDEVVRERTYELDQENVGKLLDFLATLEEV